MAKAKDNSQIVLDDILQVFHEERAPSLSPEEYFELFCAEQILKNYELSYDELQDGVVDGEHDGGVDSFYAFANGELITEDFDPKVYKKDVSLEVFVIQSKTSPKFQESTVDKLISLSRKLFDLSSDPDEFEEINEQVRKKFIEFRSAYRGLAARFPRLTINYYLAGKRADVGVPESFSKKLDELGKTALSLFDKADVYVEAIGAAQLRDLASKQPQTTFELVTKKSLTAEKGVIALASLKDYNAFLRGDDLHVRKGIFDLNVRDFQGNTEVNTEIRETLSEENAPEFWWLNNGVTILAEKATVAGDVVTISGPQVVNGLQTSTQITDQFDLEKVANQDHSVLVKIVTSDDEVTRDRIIKATNSQNAIQPAALRATDKIQRDIESSLKARGLFYDRRKNFYKNLGKPAEKIVSISLMAQALMATLLGRPDDARARPSSLLKVDQTYLSIFSDDVPMETYVVVATLIKRVERTLRSIGKFEARDRNNLRFYVLSYLCWSLTETSSPTGDELSKIDAESVSDELIEGVIEIVDALFEDLGGTDQVAKGTDFKNVLHLNFITEEGDVIS